MFDSLQIIPLRLCLVLAQESTEGSAAAPAASPSFLQQFIQNPINLLLISAILFMLLVVRPQRSEMKKQQQMLASLKKNDRVITSGGVHGVVTQAGPGEPTITIRIDDNSGAKMTINRDAIARVVAVEGEADKKSN
jgi:preprotein translocase subunit YajC